jgi:hypothetical protein
VQELETTQTDLAACADDRHYTWRREKASVHALMMARDRFKLKDQARAPEMVFF